MCQCEHRPGHGQAVSVNLSELQLGQVSLDRRNRVVDRAFLGEHRLPVLRLHNLIGQGGRVVRVVRPALDEAARLVLQAHPVGQGVGIDRRAAALRGRVARLFQVPADRRLALFKARGVLAALRIAAKQLAPQRPALIEEVDKLDESGRAHRGQRVVRDPHGLGAALDLALDLRENLVVSRLQTAGIRTVVIISRTDFVPQPVLKGICSILCTNFIVFGHLSIDYGVIFVGCLFVICSNCLTANIYPD